MAGKETIGIVGAGVIGSAVAYALAREGRSVVLLDRAPPGEAGASYGNAGHIAAELVEPLPSPALLIGFWRDLFSRGGVLVIPAPPLGQFAPWTRRRAPAAFTRQATTAPLPPFSLPTVPAV